LTKTNLEEIARKILVRGTDPTMERVPVGQFGDLKTVDRNEIPKTLICTFFLPTPPEHAQMGKIQIMGQKAKDGFGVELRKIQPVECGAVNADKKRKCS